MNGTNNLWTFLIVLVVFAWMLVVVGVDMPSIRSIWKAPDHRKAPAYLDALKWLDKFKPNPSMQGYDKALEYAWKRFDQVDAASETLDKKADNLMRNAGLVAGLAGVVMNSSFQMGNKWLLVPSLVAFILALIFAAWACNPTAGAIPASAHDLLDDIGKGNSHDGWLAASLHCAIVGRACLNEWKAKRIRWATRAFCSGLALLLLPIVLPLLFPCLANPAT